MRKSILRLRVLRERLCVVPASLREILLCLNHLENGVHAKFLALLAQSQTLLSDLDIAAREAHLIKPGAGSLIGSHDLFLDVVVQLGARELLAPKLRVG